MQFSVSRKFDRSQNLQVVHHEQHRFVHHRHPSNTILKNHPTLQIQVHYHTDTLEVRL
jgi:hypothetical protein